MTDTEKLSLLKKLVGSVGSAEDDALTAYLTLAGSEIVRKAYPFDENASEVPECYGVLQCQIAQYLYNKQGAEGEVSHSENGISRTYESGGVPSSMLKGVIPYVGLPQ